MYTETTNAPKVNVCKYDQISVHGMKSVILQSNCITQTTVVQC